ncbi:MAG: threonine aldolase, partial [Pseudomonadota bacterium]
EMSWRAGVDILTLGLTKTGAIGCEIIILFGDQRAKLADLKARSKRSGHMPPRARFLSAQAEAMLTNDLWLDLARQGNGKAKRLSEALAAAPGVTLAYPTDGNEVFVHLPDGLADALWEKGAVFYPWPGGSHRFVCAWSTPESDIQDLVGAILG